MRNTDALARMQEQGLVKVGRTVGESLAAAVVEESPPSAVGDVLGFYVLPWPPNVNNYWRSVPIFEGGKFVRVAVYVTKAGKEFRRRVKRLHGSATPLAGPLAVEIVAHQPDHRRRDLDNLLKATLDSLAAKGANVYVDDSQIHDLRIRWGRIKPGGSVEVTLRRIPESQPSLFEETT